MPARTSVIEQSKPAANFAIREAIASRQSIDPGVAQRLAAGRLAGGGTSAAGGASTADRLAQVRTMATPPAQMATTGASPACSAGRRDPRCARRSPAWTPRRRRVQRRVRPRLLPQLLRTLARVISRAAQSAGRTAGRAVGTWPVAWARRRAPRAGWRERSPGQCR
jgi:hypothetical protein